MSFFRKSRPQDLFERLWMESFTLLSAVWQTALMAHSEKSPELKSDLLDFLENKSDRIGQIEEEMFETRKEVFQTFYEQYPEPFREEWYKFVEEITNLQENLAVLELRLFLFKSVLMQIDETHPHWEMLNQTLQSNYEKLIQIKSLINKLNDDTSPANHTAIVISRTIEDNLSFEEADKIERKRWE